MESLYAELIIDTRSNHGNKPSLSTLVARSVDDDVPFKRDIVSQRQRRRVWIEREHRIAVSKHRLKVSGIVERPESDTLEPRETTNDSRNDAAVLSSIPSQ
jgi:hypothetical protein